jgi:U3 small nucleolar RNA-associated protein 13
MDDLAPLLEDGDGLIKDAGNDVVMAG